ncbi:MAG: glycosyltransferase family 2 protein, partial [Deltaproteobacteria bacterium]|nr:glycosyltransferase family 2 protein [Deltaproteobacteria bacterium]
MTSIGIVIPVRNEEDSIALVLQDIPTGLNALVVVVDNGSTDETSRVARANGAVVLNEEIPGYGRAMLRGIDYLRNHPVDIVVFLDGDYSDYPQAMEKLIEPITNNEYDLVVSTRLDPLYDRKSLSPHVIYGNKLVVFIMNLLFDTNYTDLGPFRAIRYESLVQLQMEDLDYGWTVEMQVKAKLRGLKAREFPVRYRIRVGQSKISGTIKGTVLAGSKMLYTLLKLYSTRR